MVGLSGQCFVVSGGARAPLRLGQPVQVADMVEVPAAQAEAADGRRFGCLGRRRQPDDDQRLRGQCRRPARERASLAGAGIVARGGGAGERPASFEVETAVGTAAVRSTDWFVEASGGGMQVGVLTGSVDMTSRATRRGVLIPARWGGRLEAGRDPVPPRVWSQAEFDAVIARTDVP